MDVVISRSDQVPLTEEEKKKLKKYSRKPIDYSDIPEATDGKGWKPHYPDLYFNPTRIKALRARLGLSQREFSAMFGINMHTLRNWEQGRRRPDRTACILLKLTEADPEHARQVLAEHLNGENVHHN